LLLGLISAQYHFQPVEATSRQQKVEEYLQAQRKEVIKRALTVFRRWLLPFYGWVCTVATPYIRNIENWDLFEFAIPVRDYCMGCGEMEETMNHV